MNRLIIFLFISLFLFPTALSAQDYSTTRIAGKEYYLYKVQKGEGFYRISVNFGVSKEDIIKANPQVEEGLKLGDEILIPKKEGYPKMTSNANRPTSNNSRSVSSGRETSKKTKQELEKEKFLSTKKKELNEPHFYYHKVKKQETLYSLSKQYAVKQEDIIAQNPRIAKTLREGDIIRIPKAEDIYTETKKQKEKEDFTVKYLIHNVKAKETLFSISKRYNVKIEDIMKINPSMQTLQIGQELKIPFYQATAATSTPEKKDEKEGFDWESIFGKKKSEKIQIAFLLPFDLNNVKKRNNDRFVDFYAGAIKAIHEADQKRIALDIYTYDTGKTRESFEDIIATSPRLKEMDIILGPAYSEQIPTASEFARNNKVKLVIPFSSKIKEIETNPYLFQFNPGADSEAEFLKSLLETDLKNMNYIFADVENVYQNEVAERNKVIKKYLMEQDINFKEINLSEIAASQSDTIFTHGKKNLIFFNTDKFSSVSPYFDDLNIKNRRFDIVLLEQFHWKKNSNPRPVGLYISPFKPEYQIPKIDEYNQEFFDFFSWKAKNKDPRYDILGYDLTQYFIQMMVDQKNTKEMKEEGENSSLAPYKDGLQSEFNFTRDSSSGGFANRKFYLGETQIK